MASRAKIKALDRVFSKFVRLRDSGNGIFICCSCGQLKPFAQADAGHFINRRWMALRWDEKNVNAQCRSCNRFDEGNQVGYLNFMIKKYGKTAVDILTSMKQPHKWTDGELDILTKYYKSRVRDLER